MMHRAAVLLSALLVVNAFAAPSPEAAEPQQPRVIPVSAFTRFDLFDGMKLSPDGRFIALLGGEHGLSQLKFIDLDDRKVVSGVRTHGYVKIDTYRWIGSSRLIYTLQGNRASSSELLVYDSIFAIDRDGTAHRRIYRRAGSAQLLRTSGRNPRELVVAEYPLRYAAPFYYLNPLGIARVRRLNVYDGFDMGVGRIDTSPLIGGRLLLDRDDQVRFALGRNEDLSPAVGWKPDPEGEWQTFDLEGFDSESNTPIGLSADNRSALLTGLRQGEQFAALYRLDLTTRQAMKVLGFDTGDVDDVIRDFADQEIVGVRGYTQRTVERWLAPDHPVVNAYAALHRAFPGQRVQITSASDDGKRAIAFVDSDINPGDYYLYDTTQQRAEFLRAARTWIDPREMRPKQPITLAARDGLQLQGYVTRPAGSDPAPLVVLPHDGPWGERDTWEFDWKVQLLANRGYAVLQVNYRGSAGYGVDFENAGNGEWGGRIQDDITDATRWAIEHGIARADRICIYGNGYGGYAALMSVVREPGLFRCAIGYGVVYDLTGEALRPVLTRPRVRRMERVLGTDAEKLRALSPLQNVGKIQAPVLLIHGKHDLDVEYAQFKRMTRALQREQKKNVELMTLQREGSALNDEETRREVYERILQFLDTNLRKPPQAASR
jgi:dienelactone hydrolase